MKLFATIIFCLLVSSCVSTITTTTAPDGTVTVVEARGVDAATVATAAAVSTQISQNLRTQVRATK